MTKQETINWEQRRYELANVKGFESYNRAKELLNYLYN